MTASSWYLLCFVFGFIWSITGLLMGSFRLHGGHVHHGHVHHGHVHHGQVHHRAAPPTARHPGLRLAGDLLNVNSIAIFLAWFGGCGYLMSRHSGFALFAVLAVSVLAGLAASFLLIAVLRFLLANERVMDPFDYEMVGVVGRVASPIRREGTGEILFARDGSRKLAYARSDDQQPIERGAEVVVTRYEKGIAYVRPWDAIADEAERVPSKKSSSGGEEAPRQ
jgi:membrane protein implicated in regulation of membrane protease activity